MRAALLAFLVLCCVVSPTQAVELAPSTAGSGVAPTPEASQPPKLAELPPSASPRSHDTLTRPPRGRTCLSQAEAREKIAARRLSDPIRALRFGRQQGEALRARLCRWRPEEFVYEIYVLKRDGRLMRMYMNAETGQLVGALGDAERK